MWCELMSRTRRLLTYGVFVLTVTSAVWLYANRQYVADQLLVWQYTPTSEIQSLVKKSGMSDKGKFDFYTGQPKVEGSQLFNQYCARQEKQNAILGCYTDRQIYIYDVTDAKLAGIKSVTASHEMLHAVYDRLGTDEKARVNSLLKDQYKSIDNEELRTRMDYYQRTEPAQRMNELHSILGTEFANLNPELERYYATYFNDRKKVTDLHESYAKVFRKLSNQSDKLVTQLNALAIQIDNDTKAYNQAVKQLNADVQSFNNRTKNGSFSSQSEFDAERAALVARSSQLSNQRDSINAAIKRYEKLRADLEAINTQTEALNQSIDSSLAPAPSSI